MAVAIDLDTRLRSVEEKVETLLVDDVATFRVMGQEYSKAMTAIREIQEREPKTFWERLRWLLLGTRK